MGLLEASGESVGQLPLAEPSKLADLARFAQCLFRVENVVQSDCTITFAKLICRSRVSSGGEKRDWRLLPKDILLLFQREQKKERLREALI